MCTCVCLSICQGALFSSYIFRSCEQTELLIGFDSNTTTFWPRIYLLLKCRENWYLIFEQWIQVSKRKGMVILMCEKNYLPESGIRKEAKPHSIQPSRFQRAYGSCSWILLGSCHSSFPCVPSLPLKPHLSRPVQCPSMFWGS